MPKRIRKPLYGIYSQMVARCNSATHPWYKNYGGRGIKVCDRWLGSGGYDNFMTDMGPRPAGFSLERIDNNGNYEPDNCRWADKTIQSINQRQQSNNTTGVTGVIWNKQKNKWQARIQAYGKSKHLGFFTSLEMATIARRQGEEAFHKPLLGVTC